MAFQFLIGRLGTMQIEGMNQKEIAFQFLIGRLGTIIILISMEQELGFQFLIGRLGTLGKSIISSKLCCFNSS